MNILLHKQQNIHDPDNGVYGDCWRTVVACLLGLPRDEVPHVCDGPDDGGAVKRMRDYLATQNCALIQVPFDGKLSLDEVMSVGCSCAGGAYWTLMGTSRTGCNHVVICKNDEIVHDTSLTQAGIIGPASDGLWWIELVVRHPMEERDNAQS